MKGVNEISQQSSNSGGQARAAWFCERIEDMNVVGGSAPPHAPWPFIHFSPQPLLSWIRSASWRSEHYSPPYGVQRGPMIHKMRNHRDVRGTVKHFCSNLLWLRAAGKGPPRSQGSGEPQTKTPATTRPFIFLLSHWDVPSSPVCARHFLFKGSRQWHLTIWPCKSPLRPWSLTPHPQCIMGPCGSKQSADSCISRRWDVQIPDLSAGTADFCRNYKESIIVGESKKGKSGENGQDLLWCKHLLTTK